MDPANEPQLPPPPRAYTQGVGTVYQFVGGILFLSMMGFCCGSGLLSKDAGQRKDWSAIGWGQWTDASDPARPVQRTVYSANAATAACSTIAALFGMTLAGLGLGLQAQKRRAPHAAAIVTALATVFWLVHFGFFVQKLHSVLLGVITFGFAGICALLCALAIGAVREMRADPPPADYDRLPADFKVPYSHYHADPPDVRLARELEQRRAKLAVQQKELEMLERQVERARDERRPRDEGAGPA